MAELTMTHGMPNKVLVMARQLGLHNDCLVSGNVCSECEANIMLAFDYFYGEHTSVEDVIRAIVDDYQRDLENE